MNTITFTQGDAGNVSIDARETVSFDGANDGVSGILSAVRPEAVGNGGDINITTGSLSVTNGAQINAITRGQGNAGNVTINARDAIFLDGENSKGGSSGIFSSVADNLYTGQPPAVGDGGDINFTTGSFLVTQSGGVFASTSGQGNAGNLTVTAPQAVTLSGNSQFLLETTSDGAAGELMIETGRLTVTDGATVSSSTSSPSPDGVGGNITVNATQFLELSNGARLLAQSNDTAAAGSIEINTGQLTARGAITTSSKQSSGGDITITADKIRLFGDSDIITNVNQGTGGGGNIYLKTGSILAFDDSDILAYAQDGKGGDITFDTPAFFSENYRSAPRNTDPATLNNNRVDANASGAVSGDITTPDTTFIQNSLSELPDNQLDTNTLLASSCIVRRNQPTRGSFTITGTGGFPQRPGDAQMSSFPPVDVATLPSDDKLSNANPNRSWQKGNPIVEPQGVYRLANGKLVLSRECS